MKVTKSFAVTLLIVIMSGLLLFAASSCSSEEEISDSSVGISTDGDSEVKADHDWEEDSDDDHAEGKKVTLNTFCYACHAGFAEDKLVSKHQKEGVGCERCHGESERHRSDEDNVTPPEIMYPRNKIIPTCMICHPRPTIEHVDRHKVILAEAETIFDEPADSAAEEKKVCTDCHGRDHRMNVRTILWNKATGELLE